VIVFSAIILFVGGKLFVIGAVLAVGLVAVWILRPLTSLVRYLATNGELGRVRARAVATTAIGAFAVAFAAGWIKMPDRFRIEGVIEPVKMADIHMERAGFIQEVLPSGTRTGPNGPVLVKASNPRLETRRSWLEAEYRKLCVERQRAKTRETVEMQILEEKITAVEEQLVRCRRDLEALSLRAPISGTWVVPEADRIPGRYLERGEWIGLVANLQKMRIRAVAGQTVAARLVNEAHAVVEVRLRGRPEMHLTGRLETILPAGHKRLPSAALGYAAGGMTQVDTTDPGGRRAAESFFEILVAPSAGCRELRSGQRVVLRFSTRPKPLLVQNWRMLLQLFQRRFQV
jgi:putative peptide zinc metalloprotease protein